LFSRITKLRDNKIVDKNDNEYDQLRSQIEKQNKIIVPAKKPDPAPLIIFDAPPSFNDPTPVLNPVPNPLPVPSSISTTTSSHSSDYMDVDIDGLYDELNN